MKQNQGASIKFFRLLKLNKCYNYAFFLFFLLVNVLGENTSLFLWTYVINPSHISLIVMYLTIFIVFWFWPLFVLPFLSLSRAKLHI